MNDNFRSVFKSAFKDDSYPWKIFWVQLFIYMSFPVLAAISFANWGVAVFGVPFFAAVAWFFSHITWKLKIHSVHTPPLVISADGIQVSHLANVGQIAWADIKTVVKFTLDGKEDIRQKNKRAVGIVLKSTNKLLANLPRSKRLRWRFLQLIGKPTKVAGEQCHFVLAEGATEESFEEVCHAISQYFDIRNTEVHTFDLKSRG